MNLFLPVFSENKKEAVLKKILDKDLVDLERMALSLGLESKASKLKQKDIQPVFKKELDKLSVSQISPILIFGDFYYILQLKWKHPKIAPDEQKRKTRIEKILYEKKRKEEIHKWIEEKKASFSINTPFPIRNRIALTTGGSEGIGKFIAKKALEKLGLKNNFQFSYLDRKQ